MKRNRLTAAAANPERELDQLAHGTVFAKTEGERDELLKQVAELATGTRSLELTNVLMKQIDVVQNNAVHLTPQEAPRTSTSSLIAMQPRTFTEAMLATQMIQTHYAMGEFLARATHPEQPSENVDRNVNRAVRLGRLFTEQIEALQKLRGQSGQQRVMVEHVHVHEGGQAIVGAVDGGRRGKHDK
jgi:hypothetical protein